MSKFLASLDPYRSSHILKLVFKHKGADGVHANRHHVNMALFPGVDNEIDALEIFELVEFRTEIADVPGRWGPGRGWHPGQVAAAMQTYRSRKKDEMQVVLMSRREVVRLSISDPP
jgi:hypothetical protein